MKPLYFNRGLRLGAAAMVAAVGVFGIVAGVKATVLATMAFESQALELDSGSVVDVTTVGIDEPNGADVRFAYNADRTPHAVVVPTSTEGVELAFVDNEAYDRVSAQDVASLNFSNEPVDLPFEPYDTVVVRTDTGALFKIGNVVEGDFSVTFNYARLQ